MVMEMPPDGSWIEILGHRIDRSVGSFEDFLEYLGELERTKTNWEKLKGFLEEYKLMKIRENFGMDVDRGLAEDTYGRYCIALSIDDILKKMDEIEGNVK